MAASAIETRVVTPEVVRDLQEGASAIAVRVREGRFQKWLSLIAGASAVLSGIQVAYEHYRGSYNRRVMYTPLVASAALAAAGVAGFRSRRAARTVLPAISLATLVDCFAGFYFHIRGVQRKPGGWRLPTVNIVMGPPIFAPLLFGISAYLGLVASFLRRHDEPPTLALPAPTHSGHLISRLIEPRVIELEQDLREGRFQKQMAAATVISAFFSGFEALYSHYKSNFRYKAQWIPVVVAPTLMAAGTGAIGSRKIAHTYLPAASTLAMVAGSIGFGYHVRGVLRRPGGAKMPFYNIVNGPPVLAPLLFAASGFVGLITSLLRRERR
jgi:hypothetical protein